MSLPYFRMYPTDYEAKTAHLTIIEDGAYNRLLRLCWMTPDCSLPDDEEWIMRRVRAHTDEEKQAVKTVLTEYFRRENQRVFNNRLMREYAQASDRHRAASENGRKGGRPANYLKTKETDESYGLAEKKRTAKLKKANQNQNQNHNTPIPPRGDDLFAEFWASVPKKVDKAKAQKAWSSAVKKDEPSKIIAAMQTYAKSRHGQDQQFTAHPTTWLNGERWNDAPQITAPNLDPRPGDKRINYKGVKQTYHGVIAGWLDD